MKRWCIGCVGIAVLAGCALSACDGGQTGQPGTPASCDTPWLPVAVDQEMWGVSARELAQAAVGEYTAPLIWRAADHVTQVGATDEISVVIVYQGAGDSATNSCTSSVRVQVSVDITTRDSGIHENGSVWLEAGVGVLDPATLVLDGSQADVALQLRVEEGQVVITGTLQALSDAAPSAAADFSGKSFGAAGAGGAQ